MQIGHLSIRQLDALALAVAERRQQLVYSDRMRVRQLLREEAAKEGFTIEELFRFGAPAPLESSHSPTGPRTTYRNPNNPDQVWHGRGRQPMWMKRALGAGVSIDALRSNT